MNYPWTSKRKLAKELEEAIEESKDPSKCVRITDIDEWFDQLRNRKIPWYESLWHKLERNFHDTSWTIYRWFNPCHKLVRKSVPRKWCDTTELVLLVNFAIIKEFVENEMNDVYWDNKDNPKVFAAGKWLNKSYEYIVSERNQLLDEIDKALQEATDLPKDLKKTLTYEERYGRVNILEAELASRDRKVLVDLAEHRECLWT